MTGSTAERQRAATAPLGVTPSAVGSWHTWDVPQAEQCGPGAPLRLRLTPKDVARLDGTLAGQGQPGGGSRRPAGSWE